MLYGEMQHGDFITLDDITAQAARLIQMRAEKNATPILREISNYLLELKEDKSHKVDIFRKRTASQIIASGFQTGCTDIGIVFLALAKELDVPAFYVETLKSDSLRTPTAGNEGHVFTKIYDSAEAKWKIYEPLRGFQDEYALEGVPYTPVAIGRDPSVAYLVDAAGIPQAPSLKIDRISTLFAIAEQKFSAPKIWAKSIPARTGMALDL